MYKRQLREADDADQRCGVYAQAGVLQADERDEQADADRNALLERERNGVEDRLTHIGQRQDDKDQTLDEYREREFDRIADIVRASVDMDAIYRIVRGEV